MRHASNGMVDFNKGEKQGGGVDSEGNIPLPFLPLPSPPLPFFAPATRADLNKISLQLLESLTF